MNPGLEIIEAVPCLDKRLVGLEVVRQRFEVNARPGARVE
jgi:hypothetical protein